jgi:hypothetical protein
MILLIPIMPGIQTEVRVRKIGKIYTVRHYDTSTDFEILALQVTIRLLS